MSKQYWKAGNMLYPLPAVLVSLQDENGKNNIITVAWTGTCCTNPPMVYISIRPERYSYTILKETKEFVINLTTEDLVYATDYCGVTSGKDVDKFKETKLTPIPSKYVKASSIKESPVNIECRIKEIIPLGSHDMFLAEVLGVTVEESYLDQNNRFNLDQSNPITYSHGKYYSLGKNLGKFGYSIKKS
ncbi:MAG: flavin reductase family protein [Anaeroplasmataceae bacterium]|nr:flavin reductase family protein [Anaeroplasmataceae bacterium]